MPLCHVMVSLSMSNLTNFFTSSAVRSFGLVFVMPSLCSRALICSVKLWNIAYSHSIRHIQNKIIICISECYLIYAQFTNKEYGMGMVWQVWVFLLSSHTTCSRIISITLPSFNRLHGVLNLWRCFVPTSLSKTIFTISQNTRTYELYVNNIM